MRIDYLQEFIELVYNRNFSKTAQNLHTTQSSISKHVIALENTLGIELLDRRQAQVFPTEAGRALFEEARTITEAYERLLQKIEELKENPSLTVGGLFKNAPILKRIKEATAELSAQGTTASLTFNYATQDSFCDSVINRTVDIAFTMLAEDELVDPQLQAIFLFEDPLVAVVAKTHPLATHDTISVHDLQDRTVLRLDGSHSVAGASIAKKLYTKHDVRISAVPVFLPDITDISFVEIGQDILVTEQSMAAIQTAFNDYTVVPFSEPDICFRFYAIYRKDATNAILPAFVQALVQES